MNALYETGNPFYSIFGGFRSNNPYSEFSIKNKVSILKQLYLLFVPGINWLQSHISKVVSGNHICYIDDGQLNNEYWLFINGMGTTQDIHNINHEYLKKVFDRPINCVYNTTDSIFVDFIECVIDRETEVLTEPSLTTVVYILNALYRYDKLVVIAHSQGCLIISQVLATLKKLNIDINLIKKMEIYAFGNTASKMEYVVETYPYLETIANEYDFFSKFGNNVKNNKLQNSLKVDGNIYVANNKYGHLLNIHYINSFDKSLPGYENLPKYKNSCDELSRLYSYI